MTDQHRSVAILQGRHRELYQRDKGKAPWRFTRGAGSYVYNGRTYTDSMRQTMDQVKYTFNIVPVYPVTGDRLVFRIETNIPNFNAANVIWSPGPAAVTGWVEGGQYVIDRTSLSANIYYWLNAIYYYNGLNYTSDISISSDQ